MAYRIYQINSSPNCDEFEILDYLDYIQTKRTKKLSIIDPFWGDADLITSQDFNERVDYFSLRGFYEGFLKNVQTKKALFVSDYSITSLDNKYINISFFLTEITPDYDEIDGAIVFIKNAKNIHTNGTVLFKTPNSMVVVLKKEKDSANSQHIWLDTSFAFLNDVMKLRFYIDDDI